MWPFSRKKDDLSPRLNLKEQHPTPVTIAQKTYRTHADLMALAKEGKFDFNTLQVLPERPKPKELAAKPKELVHRHKDQKPITYGEAYARAGKDMLQDQLVDSFVPGPLQLGVKIAAATIAAMRDADKDR